MDLIKCQFVILVSVGEHTHPLPPPSHTPEAIKDSINLMINNASEHLDYITPWKIISKSSEEVQLILNEISLIDEAGIEAQVDINREGKELSLMNAIDKARKHDTRKYKTCEIQDNMGL
ncbi:44107_t:CDS:2 [Gigaspora margarita]|uniref:44107_t:CDS:1 n=1 Tax=Gigaspora margarita TaxID=4874 RepID=A0ABN7VCD3_GIGMA|nr:44107_t:CDS:2 [Gigaspora margarita]